MPANKERHQGAVADWQPITVGCFRLEATELVLIEGERPTLPSAGELWRWLGHWQLRLPWWAGDLWNIVKTRWPAKAEQMLAGLPWERETVERFARTCKAVPAA